MRTFPIPVEAPLTRTQRWANGLVFLTALAVLAFGFLLKDQIMGGTQTYRDLAAGILAQYPSGWLLETQGDFVFRVRDPKSPSFRTTLQVAVESIGADAAARNILDDLAFKRSLTLAAYETLRTIPDYPLPDGETATRLEYVYVDTEANPFLESLPVVVYGVDIVSIKGGQAIIITFQVEADRFDEEEWRLEQFLATLEF
jgi:hypothetical protein